MPYTRNASIFHADVCFNHTERWIDNRGISQHEVETVRA